MPIGEFTAMLFKIVLGVLMIVGLIYEEKLARWEIRLFARIRRRFHRSRRAAIKRRQKLTVLKTAPTARELVS